MLKYVRNMVLALHPPPVMVNKCMKFETNSLNTSEEKKDLNTKFNQEFLRQNGDSSY